MTVEKNLSAESKGLLDFLANTLFDANIEIDLTKINMETLFQEAAAQTVLALAFDALPSEAEQLHAEVYGKWKRYAFAIMQRNIQQMRANTSLEALFRKNGIPFCIMKGFASDYYYGEKKHLRQMGDIDFLVPSKRIEDAKQLLVAHGFVYLEKSERHDFHLAFQKDGELYEMHKGIDSLTELDKDTEKYFSDLFSTAAKVEFDTGKLTIPDKFTHGLIMLWHMKRHMLTGGGVGLRHLCDWAVFVNGFKNEEWVSLFEEKLQKAKLWKFAQTLSKVSMRYLKMQEKEWFSGVEDEMADQLLWDLMLGGNFGKKDIQRYQENVFVSRSDKSERKAVIYTKGIIEKVYCWKPFYRKKKLLLPIGFLAYICRTIFLVVTAKKKLDVLAVQKSGTKRNDLYNKLFR